MKSKILKIMGVALTLALVFSLGAVLTATPVAADPDEWTTYDLPDAGEDGDWFWDVTFDDGPGPIARDIDGNFWAFVSTAATDDDNLMFSSDGRVWEATDYAADVDLPILAIEPSPIDEDTVYVLIAAAVWKTDDAGDTWDDLGDPDTFTNVNMSVGESDGTHYIYVGTGDGTDADVLYYEDAFGGAWTTLDLEDQDADLSDVLAVEVSTDFANDGLCFAVFINDDAETYIAMNDGATVGDAGWADLQILDDAASPVKFEATAADIAIPQDFDADDELEFFVGIAGAGGPHSAGDQLGGVYRVYGADTIITTASILDDIDDEVMSLSVAGNIGDSYLLAGIDPATGEAGVSDVWYSDDDGDNWLQASAEGIQPAGDGLTYVICDEDIADNGMGWAITDIGVDDAGAGVNLTLNGGESWVGIGLLDTDAGALVDIGPSPDWVSDETIFIIYTNSTDTDVEMLRYDGTNFERVWQSTQQYADVLDMVDCSPDFGSDGTVYAADAHATAAAVYLSEDSGTTWAETRNTPDSLFSWLIIDSDTIIVGGTDSNVWLSDVQGRRAWDDYAVTTTATQTITSLAADGDTVICGTLASDVFLSEDFAETWDIVGNFDAEPTSEGATYVGFDTDDITVIYAASDNVVERYLDTGDTSLDWEGFTLDGTPTTISGLAVADGVIYVSDNASPTAGTDGAIQRTVNPLDDVDDVTETEFDHMTVGLLDAATFEFDLLYLSEGSTFLWGVDQDSALIYTLEDLLVGPATGGESDPGELDAALLWDSFANATGYDVRVYSDPDLGLAYECYDAATGDDDPVLILDVDNATGTDPEAGTQYWWQVRATAPVNSKWSDVWTFTTLPGTMTIDADQFGPAIGATNVPITPSFGWAFIAEADHYLFELADNPDFTTPIASTTTTNPVFELDTVLAYSTNYFWRVMAISGTAESDWATGTFTTVSAAVAAPEAPPAAAPTVVEIPPAEEIAPKWIYAIIGIGATLATVVIVLIVRTRKP